MSRPLSKALCLVQLGTRSRIYLLDALELSALTPLDHLLRNSSVIKIIHNATFELSVKRALVEQIKDRP